MNLSPVFYRPDGVRRPWAVLVLIAVTLALYLPGFTSLPPMDRDEPRFAQASKQMLETGDFVDIRYQDEARNKKPVGIYWLQASSVALGERLGIPDALTTIWLYRLPSLLGAITTVLATYWTALALTGRRTALLAALLFASTILITVEAHLAKTDAVLLATVTIAMGSLVRLYLPSRRGTASSSLMLPALFWTAIGVGILVKGPITPMIPAFALMVLCVKDRSVRWLTILRPVLGLLWVLALVLPWLVLILLRTKGAFLADSLGHDMFGKVAGVQESHGAPPGTYLAVFWVTAWPMAPFAAMAAWGVWRARRETGVAFLLAWLVPTWLLFEIVPTKLPHYVLPVYPAIAILTAVVLDQGASVRTWPRGAFAAVLVLLGILPLALVVVLAAGKGYLWLDLPVATLLTGIPVVLLLTFCVIWSAQNLRDGAFGRATMGVVAAAILLNGFVLGRLLAPSVSDMLAVSGQLAKAGRAAIEPGCRPAAFATAGDHEPSLVFLTSTTLLLTTPQIAATFLKAGECRAAFVESNGEKDFAAALGVRPDVRLAQRVVGTSINGGGRLDIGVYVRQRDRP